MSSRYPLVLGILFIFVSFLEGQDQGAIVGVLEDVAGTYAGKSNVWAVRVAFQKAGSEWKAFPHDCRDRECLKSSPSKFPLQITWTVSFDGRRLGEVISRTPKDFEYYSGVGLQQVASSGPVPSVGERSDEYSGFLASPVFRPLVTVSRPFYRDPEAWKPAQMSALVVTRLRTEFRKKFPDVTNCADPYENVGKPWPYRDENIKVLKAYSSKANWSIARVRLEESRCDGPADDPFVDQWFTISPAGQIKFLDSGMWLVDAGDYDNDGESELIFSIDRYNRGGYELFYDDFGKSVKFEFGYH